MEKTNHIKFSLVTLLVSSFLFMGCSSKQYFEPEQTFSASNAESSYSGTIIDQGRDGATLDNEKYISKDGISKITLGENYRFLSQSGSKVLAGNVEGKLKIIDKNTGKAVRTVELNVPIVAGAIEDGIVAYILNDNTFGLYSVKDDKKIIESKSEKTFAIDTRAASPMFIDHLAVVPMLDGKLIIANKNDPENATVVYLSSQAVFNNVIFLSRMGNTMVAATPKKVMTIGDLGQQEHSANISDVAILNNTVYIFTKEGAVIKLDSTLNPVAQKKFRYAHFSAAAAYGDKIYALDQQGSLIVLNADLTKSKIYDIGSVDSPVFITGSKLYKDGNIIHLDKLSYE